MPRVSSSRGGVFRCFWLIGGIRIHLVGSLGIRPFHRVTPAVNNETESALPAASIGNAASSSGNRSTIRFGSEARMNGLSFDGYVRLPMQALAELHLQHQHSDIDAEVLRELKNDRIDAIVAGHTEWQNLCYLGYLRISVGWDWYLDHTSDTLEIAHGALYTNIMCVDAYGRDIGTERTEALLAFRLRALNWSRTVARATFGEIPGSGPTSCALH
ncbi:DUF4902 domain-containing protein [Burkholderia dolosa]|uniref:DUF4902 domain-containing protein n=1 Tax=Burkholderia dolosa TaxID=152500 RepID=UPI001FC7E370|nr:DUF4902 domain-containing protein [Burkholderia dolosa]MDN7422154.1 DUF4902 domain-containing protein [Burkholderia dolosa]